jgi:hypothetical protein
MIRPLSAIRKEVKQFMAKKKKAAKKAAKKSGGKTKRRGGRKFGDMGPRQ